MTWVVPAGEYERVLDAATGRMMTVPGSFHAVTASPVGPLAAAVAIPRGIVAAGEIITLVLLVGGAFVVLERTGTLTRATESLIRGVGARRTLAIVVISMTFGLLGAVEQFSEEIIPLVPVLLVLGRGIGLDALAIVAVTKGAAAIGAAFGPTNPFQAVIAMRLADLPLLAGSGLRLCLLGAAITAWILVTIRYCRRAPVPRSIPVSGVVPDGLDLRHALLLAGIMVPFVLYVYGSLKLGWGLNHMSGAFFLAGLMAGVVGGLGLNGTIDAYVGGMRSLVGVVLMIGVARSVHLVLEDGKVIDPIIHGMASLVGSVPTQVASFLMVPFHQLLELPLHSSSGRAMLTMPILVPLSDLLGISRQVTVLAYQTGNLTALINPASAVLLAILHAAGVPLSAWLRFAAVGWLIATLIGVAGMVMMPLLGL